MRKGYSPGSILVRNKVFRFLMRLHRVLRRADYRLVYFSGMYDEAYYLRRYQDLAGKVDDPLLHYLHSGWREQRRPGLLFDSRYYLQTYPEVRALDIAPLVHYLQYGVKEDRNPNPFFDAAYYRRRYAHSLPETASPLTHYLNTGWKLGNIPGPCFLDDRCPVDFHALHSAGRDPLRHLLEMLEEQRRNVPDYFDADWYHDQTPVLIRNRDALWHHYRDYGVFEGKSPVPLFDPGYYRRENGVPQWLPDPYAEYRTRSLAGIGIRPAACFDQDWYRQVNHLPEGVVPLEHFLQKGAAEKRATLQAAAEMPAKPTISIVVPVYNPAPHHLNNCIRSVWLQAYPHWQLCLSDDCSPEPHVRQILDQWQSRDERINVVYRERNGGISAATNSAAELATGDFVAFMDNDDELTADCLMKVAHRLVRTGAKLLYTDEILIGDDGRNYTPFFKPDFNRELLCCHNYITHFLVAERKLFEQVGRLRPERDGAQDHDLVLRLMEQAGLVDHLAETVYRWRAAETSTSINHDQKSYATEAGRCAVQDLFVRSGEAVEVASTEFKFFYRPRRKIAGKPSISVILSASDEQVAKSITFVEQLHALTRYRQTEYLLAAAGSVAESLSVGDDALRVLQIDPSLSLYQALQAAATAASGQYLVFVGAELALPAAEWLEAMLEYGQDPQTGLVSGFATCLDQGERVGPNPDPDSRSAGYYQAFLSRASVLANGLHCSQEVIMPPFQLFLVKSQVWQQSGGFDTIRFPHLFAAADLACRLREAGYRHIYTPYTVADRLHPERVPRTDAAEELLCQEMGIFQRNWRQRLLAGDPYYNPGRYRHEGITDEQFLAWYAGCDPDVC